MPQDQSQSPKTCPLCQQPIQSDGDYSGLMKNVDPDKAKAAADGMRKAFGGK